MAGPYHLELPGGLLLEPVPANGESCYLLDRVAGLDAADLRDSADLNPDRDGETLGPVLRGSRSIVCDITVVGTDRADVDARIAALRRAVRPVTATWPLLIHGRHPGPSTLTVDVRPSQPFQAADGDRWQRRLRACQITLRAPDPRLLDTAWQTATSYPPLAEGGIEWPIEWPIDWGGAAYAGTLVVTAGDDDTWPQLTIHGPITDPIISNITTGLSIAIDGTISATETLVIDPQRRTVLLDGDPAQSKYSWVDRSNTQWWPLVPGGNQLGLLGTATDTTTRLGVLWRDAYL